MERVEVTQAMIGICHMQVCAVKDADTEEVERGANAQNPSGVGACILSQDEDKAPVVCGDDPNRIHYILNC